MPDRGLEVIMLDVGQGDATIIRPPDGEPPIIFDCKDAHVVLRMLDQRGDRTVGAVIFSHLDRDHIGGGLALLRELGDRVNEVYIDHDRAIAGSDDFKMTKDLIDYVLKGDAKNWWQHQVVNRDSRPLRNGTDWSVRLLAPKPALRLGASLTGRHGPANLYSAVLQIQMADRRVLIGGDAPLMTWSEIPGVDARADVFRIPHHGGALDDGGVPDGWNATKLYEAVGASTSVVSVGTQVRESWGHPMPEWIAPISHDRCRMMCTQVTARCQPDVRAHHSGYRAAVTESNLAEPPWRQYKHASDPLARGKSRKNEVPCAGTIVARITSDGVVSVLPLRDLHANTVNLWDHPLCRPIEIEEPAFKRVRGARVLV